MKHDDIINNMVKTALDFLQSAVEELRKQKSTRLKYAVIHFHTAMEMLIKVRLLSEHWSLIFADSRQINIGKFESGDFTSVMFQDAIDRVNSISRPPELSKNAKPYFKELATHRNRMIHFYSDLDSQKLDIIKAQLNAWYYLHELCAHKWAFMKDYDKDISDIDSQYRELGKYLDVIYEEKGHEINVLKKKELLFLLCPSCNFNAFNHGKEYNMLHSAYCMVCGFSERESLLIKCRTCNGTVALYGEGQAVCNCGAEYTPRDIVDILGCHSSKGGGPSYPAYCTRCDGETVTTEDSGKCICTQCFLVMDENELRECAFCGRSCMSEDDDTICCSSCMDDRLIK